MLQRHAGNDNAAKFTPEIHAKKSCRTAALPCGFTTLDAVCAATLPVCPLSVPVCTVVWHTGSTHPGGGCIEWQWCHCLGGGWMVPWAWLPMPSTQLAPSALQSEEQGAEPLLLPPSRCGMRDWHGADTLMHTCKPKQSSSIFGLVMLPFTFYPGMIFLCFDFAGLEISRHT